MRNTNAEETNQLTIIQKRRKPTYYIQNLNITESHEKKRHNLSINIKLHMNYKVSYFLSF